MKYVRAAVILLFVLGLGVYGLSMAAQRQNQADAPPSIATDREVLEIPSAYTEDMLLEGLTAEDAQDGDLTDGIMVRGLSNFISAGVCNVSYVVFDSSNQSATLTRRVQFTDYAPPRFALTEPLIYPQGRIAQPLDRVQAMDVIDGDISSLVTLADSTVDYNTPGVYSITVEVTNSFGDSQTAELPVHVVETYPTETQIQLSQPLVYLQVGETLDPYAYMLPVTDTAGGENPLQLLVESDVNTQEPGVYQVRFIAIRDMTPAAGEEGEGEDVQTNVVTEAETWMTVIVRE